MFPVFLINGSLNLLFKQFFNDSYKKGKQIKSSKNLQFFYLTMYYIY
jgi:hypothetical protein